jgi:phosphoribosylaminoimidazole carboxylase PurE protein
MTTKPVVGVPIAASPLGGMDALLSVVQMPKGFPVATVGVNNVFNGVLLALSIMALNDGSLARKLEEFREKKRDSVLRADAEVERSIVELLND